MDGNLLKTIHLPTLNRQRDIVVDILDPSRTQVEERTGFDAALAWDCTTVIWSWRQGKAFRVDHPELEPTGASGSADGRIHAHSPDWRYLLVEVDGRLEIVQL